ncbi:restriction endonuclease subunit S [Pseudoclavibacter soli]|uniref:restriction endonuclease subunit S n=1 Tax=Pseudoclavibacter soli TaxID=452623 RepID=UPI00040C8961|nr:restriction endonuclease subunit S [Pseudoclavibacter soli]
MSRIDELITQYCPKGVEFKTLGEFASLVRGNGMPKADLVSEGVGAIHYGQIYTRYGVWATETLSFVTSEKAAKLAKVDPGDIIITNTSENIEDVGKAVAWLGAETIVTGGHATVIKHSQNPKYLAYWFASVNFSIQKRKLATGTKVIDVSAKQLSTIRIPVPPLEVQREIVRILDQFTQLEAELEAELEARRRQYEYYRDQLLTFREAGGVRWIPMGEFGTVFGGLTGKSKADFTDGNARFIAYTNVFNNIAVDLHRDDRVRVDRGEKQRALARGDILFTGSSETVGEVAMSSVVTSEPEEPTYLNSFSIGFRPTDAALLDPEFSKHLFRSSELRKQLVATASGVTRFNVSKSRLAKVLVPIPARDRQRDIAAALDKFDALVNDLSVGLPAELNARRKQYEYYRDKLLTFKELPA